MKTSNKLMLGAFVLILTGMIIFNFYIKSEIINMKNGVKTNELIQETDSVKENATSTIRININ